MSLSVKKIIKGGILFMLIMVSTLLVCVLLIAGILLIYSPGKPQPFLDAKSKPLSGSIAEKIYVNINGVKQGMFIFSRDTANPVLLYLHGGMPDFFLSKKFPTGLENYFTVVWWEQRGSGMSYSADIPRETMTREQLISDALAMTNYLRNRFGKEKIYIMGHSGGTFVGIEAAARAPELYHAYIGVAQMSCQLRSEYQAYEYMLKKYKENGNSGMVRKLEAAPVTMTSGTPKSYIRLRDIAMHDLGIGTMHNMKSVITGIVLPSLACPEYTFMEKINMWRGKSKAGVSIVWNKILTTDLSLEVPDLKIPAYFIEGIYDYTCSYTEAKSYFEKLKAPVKGFYSFEQSAHSPMFEEPEKMLKIVQQDILSGTNKLADLK